jgi:hypothetical protein
MFKSFEKQRQFFIEFFSPAFVSSEKLYTKSGLVNFCFATMRGLIAQSVKNSPDWSEHEA